MLFAAIVIVVILSVVWSVLALIQKMSAIHVLAVFVHVVVFSLCYGLVSCCVCVLVFPRTTEKGSESFYEGCNCDLNQLERQKVDRFSLLRKNFNRGPLYRHDSTNCPP